MIRWSFPATPAEMQQVWSNLSAKYGLRTTAPTQATAKP